jgi:hypothetical protein
MMTNATTTSSSSTVTSGAAIPTKQEVLKDLVKNPVVKAKLVFLLASFVSLVLSVSLWFTGHELQGIFVGIWVPSILSAGSLILGGTSPAP